MSTRNLAARFSLAALLSLTLMVGGARAAGNDCKEVHGDFASMVVPNSEPGAILTTLGALRGDLNATYAFTMTSMQPGPNGTLLYTGHSVITTKHGALYSSDTGVLFPALTDANGLTPFVTVAHLVHGTGEFRELENGLIIAPGKLSFTTGHAAGNYWGLICK